MEPPAVPDLQYASLPLKPNCPIAYTFTKLQINPRSVQTIWLFFINGLGLPQAWWQPSLQLLREDLISSTTSPPSSANIVATTYDRYGQGMSQPSNATRPEPHDVIDSIGDLTLLIPLLHETHLGALPASSIHVIFISHSIGVPLTRLFLSSADNSTITAHPHTFPYRIPAVLFLDSNIANTNMTTLLPDPSSPTFNPTLLPPDTTLEALIQTRQNYTKLFAPEAPNPENLDRSTLPTLLPHADRPPLPNGTMMTVVAHDPETFAVESLKISPRGLTERYIEPAWHEYNLGLLKLNGRKGDEEGEGADRIVVAKGAGHFVQRDNPRCVADEIWKLIRTAEGASPLSVLD